MPEKYDTPIYASFTPSHTQMLATSSNSQLLVDFPILASALSNIFPYLLLVDNFLELITWTNGDPYQNFLFMVLYSVLVMYWHCISYVILPILLSFSFSCVVWSVSSVIYDSKFNEKPTIDEVLHTLHNITVRFEMLLRPIQHYSLKLKNYFRLSLVATLLTPLHVFFATWIIAPKTILWLFGLFLLTYHSPWSFSIRRLLWRSVYIRLIAFYLIGLDFKRSGDFPRTTSSAQSNSSEGSIAETSPLLSDFKILKKLNLSPYERQQVVSFEVLENERRWLGIGWSKYLLPYERANFCYESSLKSSPSVDSNFPFPVFENDLYTYRWKWLDESWKLDSEFNRGKDSDGWVYYDNNWGSLDYEDGFSKYTRSRKWTRKAILVIDKSETVNDKW